MLPCSVTTVSAVSRSRATALAPSRTSVPDGSRGRSSSARHHCRPPPGVVVPDDHTVPVRPSTAENGCRSWFRSISADGVDADELAVTERRPSSTATVSGSSGSERRSAATPGGSTASSAARVWEALPRSPPNDITRRRTVSDATTCAGVRFVAPVSPSRTTGWPDSRPTASRPSTVSASPPTETRSPTSGAVTRCTSRSTRKTSRRRQGRLQPVVDDEEVLARAGRDDPEGRDAGESR